MASALNVELWLGEVSSFLVQDSNFYNGVKNDSSLVDKYGTVNIPQMLSKPTISTYVKGTTTLPLTASAASADILSYNTQLEHSGLIYGDVVDQAQYSFNIVQEAAKNIAKAFIEKKQLKFLYDWTVTATSSIGSTTGSDRTNVYGNTAAKAIVDKQFLDASLYLNRQGVPQSGRRVVLSSTMFNDVLQFTNLNSVSMLGLTEDAIKRGAVAMYRGFEIYVSNYTSAFSTDGAKKAIGAAVVNTDKESAIFFHPDFVRMANTDPIMLSMPGANYLVDEAFTMKMWMGSSVAYKEVSNVVTGVYTVIEG